MSVVLALVGLVLVTFGVMSWLAGTGGRSAPGDAWMGPIMMLAGVVHLGFSFRAWRRAG